MAFLKKFPIITDDANQSFIQLDNFYQFLKSNDQKPRRIDNVRQIFKGYKGGIQTVNGQTSCVPVFSVIRYLFGYSDSSEGCLKVASDIERELLHTKDNSASILSSFNLYKLIAKTKFHDSESLFSRCTFDEDDILTLVAEHKTLFTENEWLQICWFENQFSKCVEVKFQNLSYDEMINLKYDKFQSLLSFKECSKKLLTCVSEHMKQRLLRIDAASDKNQIEISAHKRHKPVIIDNEIEAIFKEHFEEQVCTAVSFDRATSVESNCLQTCIEIVDSLSVNELPVDDLCRQTFHHLLRRHGVLLEHVYFIHSNELVKFKSDGECTRFLLRDSIELQTFQSFAYTWDGTNLCKENKTDFEDDDEDTCSACFTDSSSKPLSTKSFDIVQEWFLDIPAEVQILLEKFVASRSIIRAKNPELLLGQKLERLYKLFDALMNTLNKRFVGIFQQANTDALLIEYKNISSVFRITSSVGITLSQDSAEKKLKIKAEDDLLYFNAFIKKHEITYNTAAGEVTRNLSLRQCHPILMLDNLVRFTEKKDPNPGVRGNQLCTLPITVQGLPTDASLIDHWHEPDCSQMAGCQCKKPKMLTRDDIDSVLLHLSDKEKVAKHQFEKLLTWGHNQLWKNMPGETGHTLKIWKQFSKVDYSVEYKGKRRQ